MNPPLILGLGEVLWDCLPEGPRPGGAPLNFAWHARQLGADAGVVSALGHDPLGKELRQLIVQGGLRTEALQTSELPTGTVEVALVDGQPSYTIRRHVAWDDIRWTPASAKLVAEANAIAFGTCAARGKTTRSTLQAAVDHAHAHGTKVVLDLNLRPERPPTEFIEWALTQADLLKINDEELHLLAVAHQISGSQEEQAQALMARFPRISVLVVTLGAEGCLILRGNNLLRVAPEQQITVADAVGAGDAFTATVVVGWLLKRDWPTIARHANRVGGYVASQNGAMPQLPAEFIAPSSPTS